ncbi:UNVERIFIED_ORG: hypothetical protein ABIC62_005735 [Burkholderia sp. 1595]|uniref:Uncharacterized protein n=1 Tax=Paraburkholderia terricola TaxID=169427 RepID=A0ABU1LZY1_9BURK|nr:hypothetical protein [Paraburkholderia terricola]MDR6412189.1 hypothetical protein [Paraburkholderia terricola]
MRRASRLDIDMFQTVRRLREENAVLRLALELLGFDCDAVIGQLQSDTDRMWKELAFRMASVTFDSRKAVVFGLSEHGQRSADAMFTSMRARK